MSNTTHARSNLTRRAFIRRAAVAGAGTTVLGNVLAACGSSSSSSTTTAVKAVAGAFTPSAGTAIPTTTMKVALNPFADNSFYVIGMQKGWFKEAGLDLQPAPFGIKAIPSQSVSYLVNKRADMCPMTASNIVNNLTEVPDLRLLGFTDTFLGTYLLSAPDIKNPTLSQVLKTGVPFDTAIKQVMAKVKGARVAFESTGNQRPFLNLIFKDLGGLTYSQIKLTVTQDPKIIDLALGGKLDYACCNGASQAIELLNQGWKQYVSISDLAGGLPAGDPRIASNLGAPGPTVLAGYYEANQEACLRFMAVTWRIIDAIAADPQGTLSVQAPYLTSVTGAKSTVSDLKGIYKSIDPLIGFDGQAQYLTKTSPYYWNTVIGAMLSNAQKGGVLPATQKFDLSTQVIAPDVFNLMTDLKTKYEALAAKAPGGTLATKAKTHYDNRNYLDAYRFIKAAPA